MQTLNLQKLWEVCNRLSEEESELAEHDTYISLLGNRSSFSAYSFEQFLKYYSFKVEEEHIIIFNDDSVAYEDYTVGDFSYVPIFLLDFGEKELKEWIEDEVKLQLEQQSLERIQRRENVKLEIERLQKQLKNL